MKMQNKVKVTKEEEITNSNEIKNLVKLVLAVTVVFFIFYGITILVLKKDNNNETKKEEQTQIDLEKILISQMLSQPENNYYVLITIEKDANNTTYNSLKEEYYKKENHKKIYLSNLSDPMNKTFVGDETNLQGDIKNFKFDKSTLVEIESASIKSITEGSADILEKLNNLE